MKSFSKRVASLTMATAMVFSLVAVSPADAEAASKYSITKKTSITSSKTGNYEIKGVAKTQYVKVGVSGTAKAGVTVKTTAGKKVTSSTKLKGTGKTLVIKVSNKGVVGKTYKLTAKVYNTKTNKVAKTLTTSTYVRNNKFTLSNSEVSVVEDQTATVTATAKYKYSTGTYTWTTADANIATVADGVITGVNAGTTTVTVTRGNFTETIKVTVTAGPTKVESATATNSTTIELTGKHLERLTVKDVKVAGYTVETIKASEDGKTATATIGSALVPNKEETVEVTIDNETVKFTVKYSTEASAVAVKDATYGVNATDVLTVLVNGVTRTLDELKANGYSTSFYSYEEDASGTLQVTGATNNLFKENNFKSTSGQLIAGAKKPGIYKVKVVLVKGGTTLTSEYATITITDKLIHEQEIAEIKLVSSDNNYTYKLSGDSFALKVGETFELKDLKTKTTYGTDESVLNTQLAKVLVKSSDTSIATVSVVGGVTKIIAHKSGTTNLTVTYGNLTKTLALTVKTDGRYFSSVEVPAPGQVVINHNVTANIYAKDNYGAYMANQFIYVELPQNDTAVDASKFALYTTGAVAPAPTIGEKSAQTGTDGSVTLSYLASTVAGSKATFSIYKGKAGNLYEGSLLATYNMTNTAMNASSYKLEVVKGVGYSADTNIDFNPLAADDKVKIELKKFYNNVFDSVVTDWDTSAVNTAEISFDESVLCVESDLGGVIHNGDIINTVTVGTDALVVYPTGKAGSATITIKNVTQNVIASIAFTTTNTVPGVSDIQLAFNSINYDVNATIDYKNVLSVVPNKNNPEVPGVSLTNNTKNYSVVKLCTVAGPTGYQYQSKTTKRWQPGVGIPVGSLYIEAPEGNLILGTLGYDLTVDAAPYTAVTNQLSISPNQATSINFAMLQSDDATAIMNVLSSSIAVNSYK